MSKQVEYSEKVEENILGALAFISRVAGKVFAPRIEDSIFGAGRSLETVLKDHMYMGRRVVQDLREQSCFLEEVINKLESDAASGLNLDEDRDLVEA